MTVEDDFAGYERLVEEHGRLWWLRPGPHREVLRANPALRAALIARLGQGVRLVPSMAVYRPGSEWWAPRTDDHLSLLDALCPPSRDEGDGWAVYVTLGLPGAGKTSVLRPIALAHAGVDAAAAVVDADAVRAGLPDYAAGLGSAVVQDETVVVTYGDGDYPPGGGVRDRAYAAGSPVIVDVMGGPDLPGTVESLAGRGFEVFLLLADCPAEVCKSRVMRRALETGRYLPPGLIDARVGGPRVALDAAVATGSVAGWGVWETSGETPVYLLGDGAFEPT